MMDLKIPSSPKVNRKKNAATANLMTNDSDAAMEEKIKLLFSQARLVVAKVAIKVDQLNGIST
jgi:hypothetical protein